MKGDGGVREGGDFFKRRSTKRRERSVRRPLSRVGTLFVDWAGGVRGSRAESADMSRGESVIDVRTVRVFRSCREYSFERWEAYQWDWCTVDGHTGDGECNVR